MSNTLRVCIMPVKNEDWILEKTLQAASLVFDHIIINDERSTDSTKAIAESFSKVSYIYTDAKFSITENRRQKALTKAREFGSENIIFCLDADEILTANVLDDDKFWTAVEALRPGQSMLLEWINLWCSARQYRTDGSVWAHNFKPFVFRDDGQTFYAAGNVHESRVPDGFDRDPMRYEEVKILHYNFALWDRMLSKQAHWRIVEFLQMHRSPLKINARYGITKAQQGLTVQPVEDSWISGYSKQGIDITDIKNRDFFWYDIESLHEFALRGTNFFRWLDIWDIPWEHKRQALLAAGISDVPKQPIQDPRSLGITLYHWILSRIHLEKLTKLYTKILGLT